MAYLMMHFHIGEEVLKLEQNYNQVQRSWVDNMVSACRVRHNRPLCLPCVCVCVCVYNRILRIMKRNDQISSKKDT